MTLSFSTAHLTSCCSLFTTGLLSDGLNRSYETQLVFSTPISPSLTSPSSEFTLLPVVIVFVSSTNLRCSQVGVFWDFGAKKEPRTRLGSWWAGWFCTHFMILLAFSNRIRHLRWTRARVYHTWQALWEEWVLSPQLPQNMPLLLPYPQWLSGHQNGQTR